MALIELNQDDQKLIDAAREVIERNYLPGKHSVGAAVLAGSGRVYVGINVEACGYGPCAEPIAIGAAFSNGERYIRAIVAVAKSADGYKVLSPCGNCRQLLVDYSPDAAVIVADGDSVGKAAARDLLPAAYLSRFGRE